MALVRKQPVQNGAVVSVASTATVVMPATSMSGPAAAESAQRTNMFDAVAFVRTNNDGSQTLNEQVEVANVIGGPFSVLPTDALQGIAPGETRIRTVRIDGAQVVRTTATASGAGSLSVLCSTTLMDQRQ